jgi:acyl-coenzyme A synthetase/AMP-(fatty) acid ligase
VGIPDPDWGESLAAFVVLRAGQTVTGEELSNWVRETLADYKRPRKVLFVESLPRTQTGKILKRELKQRLTAQQASA